MTTYFISIIGFVSVCVALFFAWVDFSNSNSAKQWRVAIALFTSTDYSWKESWKQAKDTVK